MSHTHRIGLDLEEFRTLVRGGVVRQQITVVPASAVEITLKDIGLAAMLQAVSEAWDDYEAKEGIPPTPEGDPIGISFRDRPE